VFKYRVPHGSQPRPGWGPVGVHAVFVCHLYFPPAGWAAGVLSRCLPSTVDEATVHEAKNAKDVGPADEEDKDEKAKGDGADN